MALPRRAIITTREQTSVMPGSARLGFTRAPACELACVLLCCCVVLFRRWGIANSMSILFRAVGVCTRYPVFCRVSLRGTLRNRYRTRISYLRRQAARRIAEQDPSTKRVSVTRHRRRCQVLTVIVAVALVVVVVVALVVPPASSRCVK